MKILHFSKFTTFLIVTLITITLVSGQWEYQQSCFYGENKVAVDGYGRTVLFPAYMWSSCTFLIKKNPGFCQIRLDFPSYTSSSANSAGDCDTDRLTVRNSVTVNDGFSTCGDLTGKHMYLSFGDNCDTIEITPKFSTTSPFGYYNIEVTPIPCSSPDLVPTYCLQNYNTSTGVVTSFDYPKQQQNSQQYTICVHSQKVEDWKEISWKRCTSEDGFPGSSPFSMISSDVPPSTCDTDWIAVNGDQPRCFNVPSNLRSTWKPFLINVNFDEMELFPPIIDPEFATSAASCIGLRPKSGDLFVCAWFAEPSHVNSGTCQCDVSPVVPGFDPSVLFEPSPDVGNIGFCLKYEVQT
ncbi:hypothetical protein Fcan01_11669 [Folsomia candida]|uniref:CUB domain-containing protein n=1 Tax=Folsomia candida TaxID=158441 RepID=A0A226E9Q8_FOLCA|nr:hypothetical protein Fcan01_11669 [Folsomia candida]